MIDATVKAFIEKNPAFHLSTCEADQPRGRVIMTYGVDERGVIFLTMTHKDMHRQLLTNPRAELCYFDPGAGVMLRLFGRLEQIYDDALKTAIIEKYGFLKPVAAERGLGAFAVWTLAGGRYAWWRRENALDPKQWQPF